MASKHEVPKGYAFQALHTLLNVLLYFLSFLTPRRYLHLEGRRRGKVYRNWARSYEHRPRTYLCPENEQEIQKAVRDHEKIRVVGAGHSFNPGVVSERAMISLDKYTGVLAIDTANGLVRVKAGTRIRDLNRLLDDEELALKALPSHDAQSLAGILSTDVHGTGRDLGYVSQQIAALRIVDSTGQCHDCEPHEELFRAAVGGIGAVGIITEATVCVVEAFRIRQRVVMSTRTDVEKNLARILARNDHASFYFFPFMQVVQVNTWNRTNDCKTFLGRTQERINNQRVALAGSWVVELIAKSGLLPKLGRRMSRLLKGRNLVLKSYDGFNRTLYHLHQELECAVPRGRALPVAERLLSLYEAHYVQNPRRTPFLLIEVRFTPERQNRPFLSPGCAGPSAFLDLVIGQSHGFEDFYDVATDVLKDERARPHLGKWCEGWTHRDLASLYGNDFTTFQDLRCRHDPQGRFANAFTTRLVG